MMQKYIVDTTLRDGEQTPGLAFTHDEKVAIAKSLDQMGVARIEAGTPAMGKEECKSFERIKSTCLRSKIIGWNRMKTADIEASINCGADIIHVCAPASDLLIKEKLKKTKEQVLDELIHCADRIRSAGKEFTLGLEDASRADATFVKTLIKKGIELGATTLRFSDTVGIFTPRLCKEAVAALPQNINIEIHMHNDLGMAVANSIQGLKSGATYADCTLFGIGERAGNCNLEHLLTAGAAHFKFGIDLDELKWHQSSLYPTIFK
jgi:homocitrate synthase NifV